MEQRLAETRVDRRCHCCKSEGVLEKRGHQGSGKQQRQMRRRKWKSHEEVGMSCPGLTIEGVAVLIFEGGCRMRDKGRGERDREKVGEWD